MKNVLRDNQPHDLRAPLAHRHQSRVPRVTVNIKLVRIPIPSIDLNRLIANLQRALGGQQFALRSFRLERLSLTLEMRSTVNHHPGRVNHRQHVSKLGLGHLELGYRFPKCTPLLAVLHSLLEGRLSNSGCQGPNRYTSTPEHPLCILESFSLRSHYVLFRNLCVFEHDL